MAWLSLAITTILVYGTGWGQRIINNSIAFQIVMPFLNGLELHIPLLGPMKVFVLCIFLVGIIFFGELLLERVTQVDLLRRFKLKKSLLYSSKPDLSLNLSKKLAKLILGIWGGALSLSLLSKIALKVLIPAIAHLAFSTSFVEFFVGLIEIINPFDIDILFVVYALLILVVEILHTWEKSYRFKQDVRWRHQRRQVEIDHVEVR